MKKQITYSDAPKDIEQSLDRAVIIPYFEITPDDVKKFAEGRVKNH